MKPKGLQLILSGFFIILANISLTSSAFWVLELKEAAFSYRPEAGAEYQQNAAKLKDEFSTTTQKQDFVRLYEKTDQKYTLESDLKSWFAQGGPAPQQFRIRVKVKNYGNEVSKPTLVKIILTTKVGEFLVDQKTFLVDEDNLQKTARWNPYGTIEGTIPPIAPTETQTFLSIAIPWGSYMLTMKDQFPVMLKAQVKVLNKNKAIRDTATLTLPIIPSHFALESLDP